jgi:polysaccharide deacetylase 2 family uncharacterized protein YibQ
MMTPPKTATKTGERPSWPVACLAVLGLAAGALLADGGLAARASDPRPVVVPAPEPEPAAADRIAEPRAAAGHGAGPLVYREPVDDSAPAMSEAELDRAFEALALVPLPQSLSGQPQWRRNAVATAEPGGAPMIAVVLDDLGLNRSNTRRAISLPAPLTLAFLTYARDLQAMTAAARQAGHELLLHLPMEPRGHHDPGPNPLVTGLERGDLLGRLDWSLARFEGYVGVNNHMGSRFTSSVADLAPVLQELQARGLLFLDSKTSSASVAAGLARRLALPFAARDVFLDNAFDDPAAIRRQLAELEATARRRGFAVAIGHPHDATLAELARWLPEAARRGFALVPVSAIVRRALATARKDAQAG